jgi:phosphoribosylamine--glycine ligase/phosphoribosylaminoimidazole synthetase
MQVVVVGGGGREAAIAQACRHHGHDVRVTTAYDPQQDGPVDLVIVGPETALAAGMADRCRAAGVPCFGPTAALARLESSKGHTRSLAAELGLASPRFVCTSSADEALAWWRELGAPVVVKADGLAAGKGVVVPSTDDETEEAVRAAAAAGTFVVEERLVGPEVSLLAFCDGTTARPLPLAQDHKRIGEGDTGPNTGGMGAYAPAPCRYSADELTAAFVQPVLDHLRSHGEHYVGILYAGLMLTVDGPRLLEFNCRFGDPEAQALLPLLASDLAEVALACVEGRLADHHVAIRPGAACTVVAAAAGYPSSPELGARITGLDTVPDQHAIVFPAGVRIDADGAAYVSGGRVLAVTGLGPDLNTARNAAYAAMSGIAFEGMQVRRDIAWRAPAAGLGSYAAAGVDIDEGTRAVEAMRSAVERTHGPAVLAGVGSFGGAFSAAAIRSMDDPVLVASTDGVGTKVELAARLGRYHGVGVDIVNHCIDDVLVQGARPLFFLDYIASSRLHAERVAEVVTGMAAACEQAGCALLGGETAEMPGVYAEGAFDIAGTLIGVVERRDLLPTRTIGPGDVLLGLASSGPHTNGYSLLRRVFAWMPMDVVPSGFTDPLGDTLLTPHRSYLDVLTPALASGRVKALAHITGGGLPENLPRILPAGCRAVVELGSWPVPPLFELVRSVATELSTAELYRTLNMGIGMVVVCAADDVAELRGAIAEPTWVIGRLEATDDPDHDRLVELR